MKVKRRQATNINLSSRSHSKQSKFLLYEVSRQGKGEVADNIMTAVKRFLVSQDALIRMHRKQP